MIINFEGYLNHENKERAPHRSGVYVVYVGDASHLKDIIYIGESEDMNARINNHDKWNAFVRLAKNNGGWLHFSVTEQSLSASDRELVERALIKKVRPILNEEYKGDRLFGEEQDVYATGDCYGLPEV